MHIEFVEIANFRKLLGTRIDLAKDTTLFVGANNSGKTSAMLAMRRFLSPSRRRSFAMHDFTLCHWPTINELGKTWVAAQEAQATVVTDVGPWVGVLPTIDLWLHVEPGEMHHVRSLIPTLDWEGGRLGVRLRYEPKNPSDLHKDYLSAVADAAVVKAEAAKASSSSQAHQPKLTLWPENLVDFLCRKLDTHFAVRAYSLDPAKVCDPERYQARPQELSALTASLDGDPLDGLIRVDDIPAQRGFGEEASAGDDDDLSAGASSNRLSDQLRRYYAKHLDPAKGLDPEDLSALQAIEAAQDAFDTRLSESFKVAFTEIQGLGYPGVTDPRPHVSTQLRAIDGLNHRAAISFEVDVNGVDGGENPVLRLPEGSNGVGYQNLISMIFKLMSFRDAWMRVGKVSKNDNASFEPLHLVLIEEPEAHLHAQVQQVFIKKAYNVLRTHTDLKEAKLCTQLVVSTHSSHVAHEISFAQLRYFRRLPAGTPARVPVSAVVNMSHVFGTGSETERFVVRYLRAQHSDLFFADAAILVEGPAERMLVPNFIRAHHPELNQCYITLLEIGGSHAHRLRPLIEHLGLLTLIVTDLDTLDAARTSVQPAKGAAQKTNNATLKTWVPGLDDVDALLTAGTETKIKRAEGDTLSAVRVAYQMPLLVSAPGAPTAEIACPYTFEDALALQNLELFANAEGDGLIGKFRTASRGQSDVIAIAKAMYDALRNGKKAEFALDILLTEYFKDLQVPSYIDEGLRWLLSELKKKQRDTLNELAISVSPSSEVLP